MKLIFLRGINEDCVDSLGLMRGGDITQVQWDDIRQIYQKYSRAAAKKGRHYRTGSSIAKSSTTVSKMEITCLLKDFKEDIINNMATQLDTLQERKKHEEAEDMLIEFCPHYRQKKKDCRCKLLAKIDSQ